MRLNAAVARLTRRWWTVTVFRWLAVCELCALALGVIIVGVDKLIYLGIGTGAVVAAFVIAAVPAAVLLAAWRGGVNRLGAAMHADQALKLGDRLASAIELRAKDGPWADAVVRDAEGYVAGIRARDVFPLRMSWPGRLLVPAAVVLVVVSLLPPGDLLGRRQRAAEQIAEDRVEAERTQPVIEEAAPALVRAAGGTEAEAKTGSGLRVTLMNIQHEMAKGTLKEAQRIDLSDALRKLAARMAAQRGDPALARALEDTAKALAANDPKAVERIQTALEQLARNEDALKAAEGLDKRMRELVARQLAQLRGSERPESRPLTEGPGGELIEAPARGANGETPVQGVNYARVSTGIEPSEAKPEHDAAVRAAEAGIESGAVPARYARLVRGYFDAIKPAGK